jgi:hypothetical protein
VPAPLADDATLGACGVGDGDALELLVRDAAVDASWSNLIKYVFDKFETGGEEVDLSDRRPRVDAEMMAAIAWGMNNEVRLRANLPL